MTQSAPETNTLDAAETIGALQQAATQRLAAKGSDSPRLDARVLLAHALGAAGRLYGREDDSVGSEERARFAAFLARRMGGEPVSRILGFREFWSLEFTLSPATLDPRPDSETLIDILLEQRPDRGRAYRILDLGTGTGCLLLAALTEFPNAEGVGVDIEAGCIEIARLNAEKLGLSSRARMIRSRWSENVDGPFDIVLSNPPYIRTSDIANLQPEVKEYDPMQALDGGPDGLDAYRNIAEFLPCILRKDGIAVLECGMDQGPEVFRIMEECGLLVDRVRKDLAGIDRCISVRRT